MIAGWRSKTVAFVAILAFTTFGALATASAQQQVFPTAPPPVITSRGPVPLAALPPTAWADERAGNAAAGEAGSRPGGAQPTVKRSDEPLADRTSSEPIPNALAYAAQPIAAARTVPMGFTAASITTVGVTCEVAFSGLTSVCRRTPRDAETAAASANALRHVANLAVAARKGIEPAPSLAHEAFEVAQWASQSSAAAAIQRMSTRFVEASSAAFGIGLVLRGQDTFAAHTHPKPLTAKEVQMLLGPDKALVFFLAGASESYIFALTREGFEWRTIPLGEKTWRRRSPPSAAASMSTN
jgi:hypothetical protein